MLRSFVENSFVGIIWCGESLLKYVSRKLCIPAPDSPLCNISLAALVSPQDQNMPTTPATAATTTTTAAA